MISERAVVELDIHGMTCASCAARIEKKLNRLDGVEASVNYATEKATVRVDATSPEMLIHTIEQAGYGATLPVDSVRDPDHELRSLRRRVIIAAGLSLPVIVVSMVPGWQFPWWQWIAFGLTLPVVCGPAGRSTGRPWSICCTATRPWTP